MMIGFKYLTVSMCLLWFWRITGHSSQTSFVSAQKVLAVGAFVTHRVERFDAAWHACTKPESYNAKDSCEYPSHGSRFRLRRGFYLTLTVRTEHVQWVGPESRGLHNHHHLLRRRGSSCGCHPAGGCVARGHALWLRVGLTRVSGGHTLGGVHWRRSRNKTTCCPSWCPSRNVRWLTHRLLVGRGCIRSTGWCWLFHDDSHQKTTPLLSC